jgi:hypothetical protein
MRRGDEATLRVPTDNIRIVVSRNWSDVRAALGVAHETFVESGFQRPLPSAVRLLPAHLNPGTWVALGLIDGRPGASLTITYDGPFGLAADRAFAEELDVLRADHDLVEAGSFGVHRWARQSSMRLLAHLFGALMWMLRSHPRSTFVVGSFDSTAAGFYGRTFGMLPLTQAKRPLYGEPAHLLGCSRSQMLAALEEPGGLRADIMKLSQGPQPWLSVNLDAPAWPLAEVAQLLAESGELERMRERGAIAQPIIAAYRDAVAEEEVPAAADNRWLGVRRVPEQAPARGGPGPQPDQVPSNGEGPTEL